MIPRRQGSIRAGVSGKSYNAAAAAAVASRVGKDASAAGWQALADVVGY